MEDKILTKDTVIHILAYLERQPYNQVAGLIQEIVNSKPYQENKE